MKKDKFDQILQEVKEGKNPSGLHPVEYRLVVLSDYVDPKTGGGILDKPAAKIQEETWGQTRGYVVAVSDMAFTGEAGRKWTCSLPVVGNKILFAKYAGQLVDLDDTAYRMISDKDVLAVIKEE